MKLLLILLLAQDGPVLAEGFEARLFARDPQVHNPCSMAFDARGRLFVGQGPQYRNPKPDTPGDSVLLLIDSDKDGVCDRVKTFATGLNCIQGLAWKGRDLWIANSPDLTVVRDLDGDDEADEYLLVYTDLGNLEHALHGLNWGPDGKLYMSKGNSKGLTRPGRIAPKAFRDLWGVEAPEGTPDLPPPIRYTKDTYAKRYHHPADDWGREGGILRCDDMGRTLEIVSRGLRNPWDIAFDDGFDWIGTDNDQNGGDRIFMPFMGAHFGWGHPWSYHWTGEGHLPTAPISSPVFLGSGTGVVFSTSPVFPEKYRNVFFINDWLNRRVMVYRPAWKGALMLPEGGTLDVLAHAKTGRSMGGSSGRLFDPTDLEIGPDGALWVLSWGRSYGATWKDGRQTNEGRIYRILPKNAALRSRPTPPTTIQERPVQELVADLDHDRLPARRTAAQEELVRRGRSVIPLLRETLHQRDLSKGRQTWTAWTLGRIESRNVKIDEQFASLAKNDGRPLNLRIQAVRILAHRIRLGGRLESLSTVAPELLRHPNARVRFETVLAVAGAGLSQIAGTIEDLAARETDRLAFYGAWTALRELRNGAELRALLRDDRAGVRRAALLALLHSNALEPREVEPLANDRDPATAAVASLWRSKTGRGKAALTVDPPGGTFPGPVTVRLDVRLKGVVVKVTLDGSAPTDTSPTYRKPLEIRKDTVLRVALLDTRVPIGPVITERYRVAGTADGPATGIRPGAAVYDDRTYTFTHVPPELAGLPYVKTSNDKAGSRGERVLTIRLSNPGTVFVGHDVRMTEKPAWMRVGRPDGFERTDLRVATTDTKFLLYRKDFPSGMVVLGGNTDDGVSSRRSNYVVVLREQVLVARDRPTTMDEAMAALDSGDPARGRELFLGGRGAGCFKCHRVGTNGNPFAPDLSEIGSRADARALLEAILDPNATITEGYSSLHVRTKDGADHVGFLLEETGLSLSLVTAEGRSVRILKKDIEARRRLKNSAMPGNFASLLSPRQVADLVSWLRTLKGGAKGFGFEKAEASVRITRNGAPVATYFHSDGKIGRPYLAHARAPDGTQVTRTHPPVKGKDATDHATMHPGIWLAFGDLGGVDFWRNRGRVRTAGVKSHADGFTATNRWGDVCTETARYSFAERPNGTLIVRDSAFSSKNAGFAFGDQEEMGLGIRVASPITVKAGGRMLDAEGRENEKAIWGKASDWCLYEGTIGGRKVGMLVMPDPGNFRPSWFHARDYGVLVANAFGRKAFRKGRASRVEVKKGEIFRLRFGILLYSGEIDPAAEYAAYLKKLPALPRPE